MGLSQNPSRAREVARRLWLIGRKLRDRIRIVYPGPGSEAYPPSSECEEKRYGGDPPVGGSTIICPVGVRGDGGGSASRFSASFLIKFETYELG